MSNSVEFLRKDATFVPEVRSPTVRRRELGALLRELRTEKGLTVEQAADRLLFSMSKLSRMETGHGVATPRDIRDLCDLYGVTDEAERERMMQLAAEGKQQAWWQSYDLGYATYVGLEAEAVAIAPSSHRWCTDSCKPRITRVPATRAQCPGSLPDQIDLQIEAKLTRQRILTRDNPPRFTVVLDEAALHRMVGRAPGHGRAAGQDPGHVGFAEHHGTGSSVRTGAHIPRWRATSPSSSCQIQLPVWSSSRD